MPISDDEMPNAALALCFRFAGRLFQHLDGQDPEPILRQIAEGSFTLRATDAELAAQFPDVLTDADARAAAEQFSAIVAKSDRDFAKMILMGFEALDRQ
jgi:hypothetical protein